MTTQTDRLREAAQRLVDANIALRRVLPYQSQQEDIETEWAEALTTTIRVLEAAPDLLAAVEALLSEWETQSHIRTSLPTAARMFRAGLKRHLRSAPAAGTPERAMDGRTHYPRSRPARPSDERTWPLHAFIGNRPGDCGACPFSVNDPIHSAAPSREAGHRPSPRFEDGSPPVCIEDDETWPCSTVTSREADRG